MGVWHWPLIMAGGEPVANRVVLLVAFPLSTITASIILGYLRLSTDSVWPCSVAHSGNNGAGSNLSQLAFTGKTTGALPNSALVGIVADAIICLGIIAFSKTIRTMRPWTTSPPRAMRAAVD
jgi:Type II CAAX prenyl endopeptidase Rce1-like